MNWRNLIAFCSVALLVFVFAGAPPASQAADYEGTLTKHSVTTKSIRAGCPGTTYPERTTDKAAGTDSVAIPSDFTCDAIMWNGARLNFDVPGAVTGMVPDGVTNAAEVTIIPAPNQTATAELRGTADPQGTTQKSYFLRAGFELPASVVCSPPAATSLTLLDGGNSQFTQVEKQCPVTALKIIPGSIEEQGGKITKFMAEWVTTGLADLAHGSQFPSGDWRGGQYTVKVRSVYEFLVVLPPGVPPQARDDYITTYLNTPVTVPVLNNDQTASDTEFDLESIQIGQAGPGGAATPNVDGTIAYTPDQGFSGEDTFTYSVMDAKGLQSQQATVNVTVKNMPAFTGCVFDRQNHHLHMHHPVLYSPIVQAFLGFPPLDIRISALRAAEPVEAGIPVQISSSKTVFPGASWLPELTQSSANTNANGVAAIPINPPKPNPTDTILLTANVTIDGNEYSCEGALVVGLGVQVLPYLDALDDVAGTLQAVLRMDDDGVRRGRIQRAARRPPQGLGLVEDPPGLSRLPLIFEQNRGQAGDSADFIARIAGARMQLSPKGMSLGAGAGAADEPLMMEIVGGSEQANSRVVDWLPGTTHYLIGKDPGDWLTGVRQAAKVKFDAVYPGVDVVYYGNRHRLEYDFVVAPGADPDQIHLRFPTFAPASVDERGDLILASDDLSIQLKKPLVYQEMEDGRVEIAGGYRVDGAGNVRFDVGDYDSERALVIDPILEFSSYLGGGADESISDVALDGDGNIYITGATASPGLATEGALQGAKVTGGSSEMDAFVAKFNPSGSSLLYLTYIGGTGEETGFGVAVDSNGNILVTGTTTSADFPTVQPIQAQFANAGDPLGFDSFILKLNAQGSALIYSTYLGGSGLEIEGAIDVDAAGNAYVAATTTSIDLPVVNALQPVRAGSAIYGPDAMVAKLDPNGQAIYVTHLGASAEDWAFGITADPDGNAWVTGMTKSLDFPIVNPLYNSNRGVFDAFLTKISSDGQSLLYSSYLGGTSDDAGRDVAVDGDGNIYVTGSTGSTEFPTANGAQPNLAKTDELGQDAFVTKLSPDGSTLVYSTFFGGTGTELSHSIALDTDGSAYISGETDSSDLPLEGAFQTTLGGLFDAFVAKLDPTGSTIEYSTYIGGSGNDGAPGVAVDAAGSAIAAGVAVSPDFPVTVDAFQTSAASEVESFVVKLALGDPPPMMTSVSAASFSRIYGLSPESLASGFGAALSAGTEVATGTPLPTELASTQVVIVDSADAQHLALLLFVTPGQINFIVPAEVALGLATISVVSDGQVTATETVRISEVAPALFAADASGTGVAAALFLLAKADGTRVQEIIFDPNTLEPIALDLGEPGDQLYLFLFGTGLRGLTEGASATVGGQAVTVLGPVAQGEFPALDQANLGPLPESLRGAGLVDIVLTVDGQAANVVTVMIQ